ncbi:MAG: hypothetical protein ACUZ8H_05825 [Candidatus Anammoxibacter sp.]
MKKNKLNKKNRNVTKKDSYTCKSCGKGAISKQNLCSPIPEEKAVVCSSCGKIDCNAKRVCHPEVIKFKCDTCGRSAVSEDILCSPVKAPQSHAMQMGA